MYCVLVVVLLQASTSGTAEDVNLRQKIEELAGAIRQAEEAIQDRGADAYLTNMPLARLKLRKARLLAVWPLAGPADARTEIADAHEALERLEAGVPAFEGETGHLERAYITRTDDTAQPYYVYVPEDYDDERPWPLIVFLHGYVDYTSLIRPWVLDEAKERVVADNGAILLTPYGRRNSDFQGVGEVDVLRSIEEMKRFYSIDPDRIYLAGPSMGGMGTWTMSLRYPGMFAACAPMCAQTDMFVWWPWPHLTAPGFKQFLGEWDDPIDLAPNAASQRYFLQHGEFDLATVPVEQSHMMRWEMERLGTPIGYFEHPGEDHFIYQRLPCYQKAFPWLVEHTLERWPRHVRIKSFSYRYDTAYWLRIAEYEKWGTPGFAEATVEGNRVELTTENVARVGIRVDGNELFDRDRPIAVVANGKQAFTGQVEGETLEVVVGARAPDALTNLRKRRGLCGPLEDVFNGPFTVVAGTIGSDEETQRLAAWTRNWLREWDAFADGVPPAALDTEVTEEIIARRNLVLFGTRKTNRIIARIADRLPVQFLDDGYAIGGKTYTGSGLGLALCYPNPLNPDRYVLIYSGEDPGPNLGANHKHDLMPDYFVFTTEERYEHDGMYRHLCAGFFDLNWQVDLELMDTEGDMTDRYFGSAATVRDRTLAEPILSVTNGYAQPLYFACDGAAEVTIAPGEKHEQTVEAGRHLLASRCPDGVTRTEERLMVPEFRYEWRIPPRRKAWGP